MAASSIERAIEMLERWGFVDVVLPFMLIFTVVFAVFERTHILGKDKKNFNAIVATVMALMVVIPHVTNRYPRGGDPVEILNNALPQVSLFVIAVVALLVLLGVFGQEKVFLGTSAPGLALTFSLLAIIGIFGSAANWWGGDFENWLVRVFGADAIAVLIMLLVFGLIIWFIARDPAKPMSFVDTSKLFDSGGKGGGGHHG
jgi:hypothetical protein